MRSGAELLTGSSAAKCFSVTDYFSVHHTLSVEIGQPLLYTEQVRAGLINTFFIWMCNGERVVPQGIITQLCSLPQLYL